MFSARTAWPLAPNRLAQEIEERLRRKLPLFDLTESNPTRCGFAYDAREVLSALSDSRSLDYEPNPRGPLSARQAIAAYYAEKGVEVTPQQIFITTGTSEAYSYLFRLLADSADKVLVPRPSYPLLEYLGRLDNLQLAPYRLVYARGWRIDLESVEAALDSHARAVLVVQPNNPTGSLASDEELHFLSKRCADRGVALIADEVFSDFKFPPGSGQSNNVTSVASHAASRALTFTLSGLSKISALPQMKLAWMVASGPPDPLAEAMARLELIADTYLSVSGPLATALPQLLGLRHAIQPQIMNRVLSNLCLLDARLAPASVASRLEIEGGWYAVLKLPTTRSDEEWAVDLVERDGVIVHPGHFYDFETEGHLVVSLLPRPEIFEQGISKLLARVAQSV